MIRTRSIKGTKAIIAATITLSLIGTGFWLAFPARWSEQSRADNSSVFIPSDSTQSSQIQSEEEKLDQFQPAQFSVQATALDEDDQGRIPELLNGVESLPHSELEVAEKLANADASRFDADTFLRWSPVLVRDLYAFVDVSVVDDETVYAPKKQIEITPFSGTTITAENLGFRAGRHTLSWRGKISSGGTGRVSVHLTAVGEGEKYMAVSITSDVGAFRVRGLEGSPYHIVMELNPAKPEPTMDSN